MLGRSTTVALALGLLALPLGALPLPPAQLVTPQRLDADQLAQVPRDGSYLLLLGATFDPTIQEPDFRLVGLPGSVDGGYGIVQFRADQLAAKEELAKAGIVFVGYLPDNAFTYRITPEAAALLSGHPSVRWVGPYKTGYKIHPDLWPGASVDTNEITVRVFPDFPLEKLDQEMALRAPKAIRLQISDPRAGNLRYGVAAAERSNLVSLVSEVAAVSGVAFVEPYRRPILHNNDSLGPIQSNVASVIAANACTSCTIFNRNITGTGQIAAVADSGNDSDMCFFRNDATAGAITDSQSPTPPAIGTIDPTKKVIAYYVQPGSTAYDSNATCPGGSPISFHGTHTSATVVGDNFASPSTPTFPGINTADGMAPNAKLVFQDVGHDTTGCLSGLNDPYGMYLQALNAGARVHSNSYGAATGGEYTGDDAIADRFLFEHEEMGIFFSSGNSGSGANTIGSPGNAKNVVTVGRVGHGNSTTISASSSRGPTDDGRKKPDIMAPGSAIVSAGGDASHVTNNCTTSSLSGTSMSCPTTAGGAVLLRQYFEDGYYPTGAANAADSLRPRAALVKAALLNGTLPIAGTGPETIFGNNQYGWGRVFLDNDLFFTGDARELRVWNVPNTDGLQTGGSHTYQVAVAAGQEFRATLVWMDPEPSPGVAVNLVNNLDLTVADGTNTYIGNVMTGLASTTGGTADVLNNVEQVRRTAPLAATHTITVSAPAVPGTGVQYTNRQGYALVVSYAACSTAVAAAPTGLAVVNNPPMGTSLSWTNAGGSTTTQVYRAAGTCAGAAAGDFQYIGSSAGTSFIDPRAQGGATYAYKVRGTDTCGEGPASTCVEITPAGTCDLVPSFAGLGSASGGFPDSQSCRVRLAWTAGTASCPAGPTVRYNIYRSTTPNFTPAGGNLLTSVTGVTTYDDEGAGVVNDTTYHYVVRAEDSTTGGPGPNGGNQEPNNLQLFATALGAPGAAGTFSDGAGDGHAYGSPEPPWRIVSAVPAHTGTFHYHAGFDGLTTKYAPGVCAAIVTPRLSIAAGSVLSYWVNYNAEFQWDGAVVEISTDGGGSWSDLPPTTPVGYPSVLVNAGNACGYPVTQGAFTGPTTNAALTGWTQFQTNLAAFAGQTNVKIRWRFSSDGGVEFQGFYLDDIQITSVNLPGSCTPTPVQLLDWQIQ